MGREFVAAEPTSPTILSERSGKLGNTSVTYTLNSDRRPTSIEAMAELLERREHLKGLLLDVESEIQKVVEMAKAP